MRGHTIPTPWIETIQVETLSELLDDTLEKYRALKIQVERLATAQAYLANLPEDGQ